MTTPTDPLYAASHMQDMASKATDRRMATAMTVLSVTLLGLMLVKEAKELFETDKFDPDEVNRRQRPETAGRA